MMCLSSSPSFSILILLNPNQFEGSESWSIRETLEDGVNFGVRFANLEALGCVLTEVFSLSQFCFDCYVICIKHIEV